MRLKHILLLLIVAFVAVGCQESRPSLNLDNFTKTIYAPRYADGFRIVADPETEDRLLLIDRPWQGATSNDHHLLIVDGESEPPTDFEGAVIEGAAKRVVVLSSSSVAMFEELDAAERIVGVSGVEYISNPTIQVAYHEGKVLDIGYGANLNFEAIMVLRPDLVILYGVTGEEVSVTSKLKELSIPYIYVGDYAEESPLAKAEWLVAIAQICGATERGIEKFETIEGNYISLRDSIEPQEIRPRVMLNTPYRDIWYMPSSKSYMAQIIEDAGGEYIYKGNSSDTTQPISLESAYALVSKADIWLNLGASVSSAEMLKSQNPLFSEMDVVRRGEIYNTTARVTPAGGSDFWESGVVRPDLVLADLATIMRRDTTKLSSLYFYERMR